MELACPSCSSKHKTEDYPGAFEIQCSCGYSILVPDEASMNEAPQKSDEPPPSFDDAPMAMDELADAKFSLAGELGEEETPGVEQDPQALASFSSLNLTDPENLPDGMPYDPFELQNQWQQGGHDNALAPDAAAATFTQGLATAPKEDGVSSSDNSADKPVVLSSSTKVEGQDIVNRIQLASIGYLQGPLFDLEIKGLSNDLVKDLALHTQKFLSTRTYLREGLSKDFEDIEALFKHSHLHAVPEILAVEIYLYCSKNQIACHFSAHKDV